MTGPLAAMRRLALAAVTVLVAAASAASFAESYRGLYDWAAGHGLSGGWAVIWPLQVDVFIAVGELALVVAVADRWPQRSRAAAWAVTLAGLAVSVAGNAGHVSGPLAARATAAIPPLAAAAALAVGLRILKRAARRGHAQRPAATTARPRPAASRRPAAADTEAAALAALAASPAMSGGDLAAAIGVSPRTGRRYRARLSAAPTAPGG